MMVRTMMRPLSFALFSVATLSAQWPQFRGPGGLGVAETAKLPIHFGPSKNVHWRTELPPGHSSPVISGDRIFVTAVEGGKRTEIGPRVIDEGKLLTICLDRNTGKILWRREAPRPR